MPRKFEARNIQCTSKQQAHDRAKAASGGKEPMLHGGHKPGQQAHYHLANHQLVKEDGKRIDKHYSFK